MASLAGHISAFLFLFPTGIRRLSSTITLLLHSPNTCSFQSRPWYFSDHSNAQLRLLCNADLYALLLFLPIAAFSHLFLFLTLHRLPFALHSAVLTLFFLLLLLHCAAPSSLVPDDVVFFLAALAFLAEYGLSMAPDDDKGIEARSSQLMSVLTILCVGACMVLAVRKSAVAADFALAMGMAMKGTWALQASYSTVHICIYRNIWKLFRN